jgi:hypothetical protein
LKKKPENEVFFTNHVRDQKNKFPNFAGYTPLKYVFSGKPLITPETRIGKFQKWMEIKVNYPTDKKNTPEDFFR